jgi:ATP-binding cassette subfamily C protein CydC
MSLFLRLLQLANAFYHRMFLAVLLGFMTVLCGVGLLSTSAYLIAHAALQPSIAELQVAIVAVRAFGLGRGIFRYLERLVSHDVAFRVIANLRTWILQSLVPLAPARLGWLRRGDLLSRIVVDTASLEDFFVRGISPLSIALGTAAGMMVFMGRYHPRLVLILLLAYLSVFLLTLGIGLINHRSTSQSLATQRGRLQHTLLDAIEGAADLLSFGYDSALIDQCHREQVELSRLEGRHTFIESLAEAGTSWVQQATLLAVLLIAIPLITEDIILGVDLPLILMASFASFEAFTALPRSIARLEGQLAAVDRLFAVADAPPAVFPNAQPDTLPTNWSLTVRNLAFTYPGQHEPVLKDLSFEIAAGGQVAIVGSSGAGKSTLAHLCLRFWDFEIGEILFGDQDIRRLDPDACRDSISFIGQDTALFYGTLRANLELALPGGEEQQLRQALEQAQLLVFVEALPHGLDTLIGEAGQSLSGGERQRLSIARVILHKAPILILDEPTANLDPETEAALLGAMQPLIRAKTSLMITHRLVHMEQYDHILVLQEGRLIEAGTHHQLLAARGIYAAMWRDQQLTTGLDALRVAG